MVYKNRGSLILKVEQVCLCNPNWERSYSSEVDTETNNVTGYDQLGYDGEDLLPFDLKTETWIAPKQ